MLANKSVQDGVIRDFISTNRAGGILLQAYAEKEGFTKHHGSGSSLTFSGKSAQLCCNS